MSSKVNLFFFPEFDEGADEAVVKGKLAKTLSVDEAKVETWFASSKPTIILKSVDEPTALKYVDAIRACGAMCDIQEVGADDWSLAEMTKADIHDYFVCPSCEYDEEIERGTKLEQCPKCGLVIAKWEEKMAEEAEKEKIRRRLLRDQRLQGDRTEELEKKRQELERLRRLEREIMEELGIRPLSKLWLLFEQHPISISFAVSTLIVIATGFVFRYADLYLDGLTHEELVAEVPGEQIQHIAPVISAAVELQNNGNEQVVTEMADATQVLRGKTDSRQAIVGAAHQMMKGADSTQFLTNVAENVNLPKQTAQLSPGETQPAPVNMGTIGGVSGLAGVSSFSADELAEISPPLLAHGHEELLRVLSEKRVIPDPVDSTAPELVVQVIDELDGSMMIDLMNTLSLDREWDQYLAGHVRGFLAEQEFDRASELINRIKNPVARIDALGELMVARMANQQPNKIKLLNARVRLDLDRIDDVGVKAMVILRLGKSLGLAGVTGEPGQSMERIAAMAVESSDTLAAAGLYATLATAYAQAGNHGQAGSHFANAQRAVASMKHIADRIAAFTRIAQRYYDARNTTLANEILSEASILAATELGPASRSVAFGEIAVAQGYMGDFVGARMSMDNAGRDVGKQQLIAKLAESLVGQGRYYEAISLMETLENELEYHRLELRLSSNLIHEGRTREASQRLGITSPRVSRIYDLSERGLVTSQYARLYMRLGEVASANELFEQALALSDQIGGRRSQINRGVVALDWARSLRIGKARSVLEGVADSLIKEPIDNEVTATQRIVSTLLPKALSEDLTSGN